MIVEAATPQMVRKVALAMRERDKEEFFAVSSALTTDELVFSIVARFGQHRDVIVAGDEAGPIAVGGLIRHRPNVASLLMFANDGLPRIGADLTRFIRNRLFPSYRADGVHRIECASIDGYAEVHRWLKVLGLKQEAVMPGYGRGGETYIQFAWVERTKWPF